MLRFIKLVSVGVFGGLLIAGAFIAQRYFSPVYAVKKEVAAHFAGADLNYHEVLINPAKGLLCGVVDVVQPGQSVGQVNFFLHQKSGQLSVVASTDFSADLNSLIAAQQLQYDNVKFWNDIEACLDEGEFLSNNLI